MSQPPSFAPEPRRPRPSAQGARPAGSTTPGNAPSDPPIERVPLNERVVPASTPEQAPPPAEKPPRMDVLGVAADGASPRQWRIPDDTIKDRPNPTTADQPFASTPPSFAPTADHTDRRRPTMTADPSAPTAPATARALEGSTTPATARASAPPPAMPPAYAPQRAQAPSYAPQPVERPMPSAPTSAPGAPRFTPVSQAQATPAPQSFQQGTPRAFPQTRPRTFPHQPAAPRHRRRPLRKLGALILTVVLVIVGWGVFLLWDANANLGRKAALSGAADTPGTTYLLAGSDSRSDGAVQDDMAESERSDSIMLVNVAENGQAVAVSIPRDTYAEIPGHGSDKINASYSYGGPELLVKTVEKLTDLTVDHYVEVGMGGVAKIVDAVDGVDLCYDADVSDPYSGLQWTAGCHDVDGATALQFSRMRYQDPRGDIGRTERQRQVISKVVSKAASAQTLLNPARTLRVERAGSSSFTVDRESSVLDVARLAQAFRAASESGMMGTPPIENIDYTTDAGASAILLEDETAPDFFTRVRQGKLTTSDLNVIHG